MSSDESRKSFNVQMQRCDCLQLRWDTGEINDHFLLLITEVTSSTFYLSDYVVLLRQLCCPAILKNIDVHSSFFIFIFVCHQG